MENSGEVMWCWAGQFHLKHPEWQLFVSIRTSLNLQDWSLMHLWLGGLWVWQQKRISSSSDCRSKPVTANLKGSNRTSLQLTGGTTHATYIRISLLLSRIGLYPSPKWPQIEGWNFLHRSAMSVVILCKVMKIIWFEEANFKLSGCINNHSCCDWDVTDTHLSLTLPSNKPEYLIGVLFPTLVFWGPFFLEWIVMSESYLQMLQ